MKKLLLIILFFIGCEESSTESIVTHGCLDSQAYNYDSTASIDNNTCTYIDSCGVIDMDKTNDCVKDCAGIYGGTALLDNCNVCDADATNDCVQDCAGTYGGTALLDNCGVCDADSTNDCTQDCTGVWGGTAQLDNCNVCDSDFANNCIQDCEGVWGGDGIFNIYQPDVDMDGWGYNGFGHGPFCSSNVPDGYVLNDLDINDNIYCLSNIIDCAGVCDGTQHLELWDRCYDIEETTNLYLYNQGYTGDIPSEIGSLTNLTFINLSSNQLSSIPPEIGNLTNLTQLELNDNQLTLIPPEIYNLRNLLILQLSDNQLKGEIPPEIGNLTNLGDLILRNNQLTGDIPPEIGNLTDLAYYSFQNNQLTGDIPQAVCDLIENNNLWIGNSTEGNNLTNTCD